MSLRIDRVLIALTVTDVITVAVLYTYSYNTTFTPVFEGELVL